MKKYLILIASLVIGFSASAQSLLSTTITGGAGTYLLSTNRIKLYSIEVSSTNAYAYRLFDNDNTNNVPTAATAGYWGTNFLNASYVSKSTYLSNAATSFVGYNGYTNWYTNSGIYTTITTNAAATNAVPPLVVVTTGGAETRVNYVDALFTRGVVLVPTGNGSITLYYRQE